jgi:hypothetical protein
MLGESELKKLIAIFAPELNCDSVTMIAWILGQATGDNAGFGALAIDRCEDDLALIFPTRVNRDQTMM